MASETRSTEPLYLNPAVYADEVPAEGRLVQVGWRSPTTGNLLRPGPGSMKDWAGDGYEPVYVVER